MPVPSGSPDIVGTPTVAARPGRWPAIQVATWYVGWRVDSWQHGAAIILETSRELDADEIPLLSAHQTTTNEVGVLQMDAWRSAPPSSRGCALDWANLHVAATGEPSGRCDHMFSSPPRPDGPEHVLDAWVAGGHRDGIWGSDHLPVVADLSASRP